VRLYPRKIGTERPIKDRKKRGAKTIRMQIKRCLFKMIRFQLINYSTNTKMSWIWKESPKRINSNTGTNKVRRILRILKKEISCQI